MKVLTINNKPNVVSNNLKKQNQIINFRGEEGKLLVKMYENNKGCLSSEQLERFIKENFRFTGNSVRNVLEELNKYIAGIVAASAGLLAAKTALENKNQTLRDKNDQLERRLSEAEKLSKVKEYKNVDIQNMTLDEFKDYTNKISEAKQATYIQDLRKKYPDWQSNYIPKEINTYNAKQFNEIIDKYNELMSISYCTPRDFAYKEYGYTSAWSDCSRDERTKLYDKSHALYRKIYCAYKDLEALLLDKNFDINTKNLNEQSILDIIWPGMLNRFTMNKIIPEFMYNYFAKPNSDLPYVNGRMFLDSIFRNRPDIDPGLKEWWEHMQSKQKS